MNPFPIRARITVIIWFVLVVSVLTSCGSAGQATRVKDLMTPAPIPESALFHDGPAAAPNVARGGQLYAAKCQACHGDNGQGDGPKSGQIREQGGQVAKLVNSALAQTASPSSWFDVVSNGRIDRLMPGFSSSLNPQDRWDVLSYVWALGVNTQTLQATQKTYVEMCQQCHGPAGKGDGILAASTVTTSFADLKWQAKNSLADISSAMMKGTPHEKVSLDEPARLAMAGYVRQFGYIYSEPQLVSGIKLTGTARLHIQVVNGTPNGPEVSSLPMTLHTYDANGEVFSRTATVDAVGAVTFTELPDIQNYFYQADIAYKGAMFYAPPAQFSHTVEMSVSLPVYEVTTDPGVISISEFHYFVQDMGEGGMNIVEFYIFENSSDRAYIDTPGPDGKHRSLKVTLPADATNLKFDGPGLGTRFTRDGTVIYDSDAVPPGTRASTIAMIYDMPYHNNKTISRTMPYTVNTWDVFLPDNILRISGMTDKGLIPIQNSNFRMYAPEKADIKAGDIAAFTITGHPRGVALPGEDNIAVTFGFVALLSAIAGSVLVVYRFRKWRKSEINLSREKLAMLRDIAELDRLHTTGRIDDAKYQVERSELKNKLRDIWES